MDNVSKEWEKRHNDSSLHRLAKNINLIRDPVSESEERDDEIDIDERTPFERKNLPKEVSLPQSNISGHSSTKGLLSPSIERIKEDQRQDYLNNKLIFTPSGKEIMDREVFDENGRFTNTNYLKSNLLNVKDTHQRSTYFNSTLSKTENIKRSMREESKTNSGIQDTCTASKPKIASIKEMANLEEQNDMSPLFHSVQTPTWEVIKVDLSGKETRNFIFWNIAKELKNQKNGERKHAKTTIRNYSQNSKYENRKRNQALNIEYKNGNCKYSFINN